MQFAIELWRVGSRRCVVVQTINSRPGALRLVDRGVVVREEPITERGEVDKIARRWFDEAMAARESAS